MGLLVELATFFEGLAERGLVEVVVALAITDELVALELFAIVPLRLLLELLVHVASVVRGRLIAALTPRRQRRSAATTDAPSVTGGSRARRDRRYKSICARGDRAHRTKARGSWRAGGGASHARVLPTVRQVAQPACGIEGEKKKTTRKPATPEQAARRKLIREHFDTHQIRLTGKPLVWGMVPNKGVEALDNATEDDEEACRLIDESHARFNAGDFGFAGRSDYALSPVFVASKVNDLRKPRPEKRGVVSPQSRAAAVATPADLNVPDDTAALLGGPSPRKAVSHG